MRDLESLDLPIGRMSGGVILEDTRREFIEEEVNKLLIFGEEATRLMLKSQAC